MTVRQSLLAILDQGPCYGYQLRAEFERRTGSVEPLNVGQIYNTLDRLERDGLVVRGLPDDHGHVYWRITRAGSDEVASWLATPSVRGGRDDLAVKIAMAATLPGVDVGTVVAAQHAESAARLAALRVQDDGTLPLPRAIMLDATIAAREAELAWLDRVGERLARHPGHAWELSLSAERPRRGRPTAGRTRA